MIGCFNISVLQPTFQHMCIVETHPLSLSLSFSHTNISQHPPATTHPYQIGRQSVECASIVLLCRLRLVVCDLSTALMLLSLNPRSYLMISLPLYCSLSAFISVSPSGGHTMDCFLATVSSSRRANCLTATTSGGIDVQRSRGQRRLSPRSPQWVGWGWKEVLRLGLQYTEVCLYIAYILVF